MRVKRLEIQGFKSFKDKTVIHFDHNITGIVGPNGCGKSNIVDAFFWVMGEQSYKHMRGNSSEDLIFNGSSKYAPLGIAEATLVMETGIPELVDPPAGATAQDVPYQLKAKEVSVTRRLYRSGEGEYFINGNLARLKDIQELFMDTGVGAKGYSVIEQGQIGKIVNAKPEERRLLVEEAAGIAKYKARKKESLRKMEATQANLARLTDILQEIEKSLGSLERQAQKARQYRKYKDELLDKEMTWGRRKFSVLQQKLDVLRKNKEVLEQDLQFMRAEFQVLENSIEVDRITLVHETKAAEDIQFEIQDLANSLSHEKSALELSKRRQGDLSSQRQNLETELEDLKTAVLSNQERSAEIEKQVVEAEEQFQNITREVSSLNASLSSYRKEVEAARSQCDASQRSLSGHLSTVSNLNSKIAGLKSKEESARAQSEKLAQQSEAQTQKLQGIEEELIQAQSEVEQLNQKRDLFRAQLEENNSNLKTQEQESRTLSQKKNQALQVLTQFQSKLKSLEELDESHEGLGDGPRAALEWTKANQQSGQLFPLTDLLQVKNGYESAIELWLETSIESLFTKNPSIISPLLAELRSEKQGRVKIQLLLDQEANERGKKKSEKLPAFDSVRSHLESLGLKVLGTLSEFATPNPDSSDSDYQGALAKLLEGVCIVETSQEMSQLLNTEQVGHLKGWSIVSLDGIVFQPELGIVSGGSLESTGAVAVLKRKSAIEGLRVQVETAQVEYNHLEEAAYQAQQEVDLLRSQIQTQQNEFKNLEIQLASLQRDIHQTQRAKNEAKSQLDSLLRDCQEVGIQAENALAEQRKVEAQLEELSNKQKDIESTISAAEAELNDKTAVLKGHEGKLQTLLVEEASLRERAGSLKREFNATKSLIADRQKRIGEVTRTLERAVREHEEFLGGETELTEKIHDLTLSLGKSKEQLSLIKDKIEQINAKLGEMQEREKELHKDRDSRVSESTQVALEIEKASGEVTHLVMNLEEKYGVGCLNQPAPAANESAETDGQNPKSDPMEMTAEEELALSEEVERLRERIRRLGEVNVNAIEEFELLKKRFDHLTGEKLDLERSLDNLRDAIEHINKTSEERFRKAFEAIADRFERLFPIIFGGGYAKLSLVYPEGSTDILDAGVDILASPPGKKVANITLLSGGEKALTAVSLIFAIFMVKPSPFCVLDEVDAPLDDANIGKFNALLREMSSKSQFILITHNKKTMELNDTLYGVTMEEPGVSKMVSIEMH